jgi:colanic acid biosynthesis glycosyl transferase WcaI
VRIFSSVVKVIFVNRYFFPDHSATSQLLTDLAFHLAGKGHHIHIVTSRQRYDDPSASLAALEVCGGVTIHRVWTSRFGRSNLFGRALDYLTFYFAAARTLRSLTTRESIVVAKTDPPLISVVAAWAVGRKKAILVNWLQDLFPEVAEKLAVQGLRGLLGTFLRHLRDRSLREATLNVVVGEQMAVKLRSVGIRNTIAVVHNWADGIEIRPLDDSPNALRAQWGLKDKFVIGYSGNMGRAHEFETTLAAAEGLKHEADYVFLFCGGGNQCEWIRQQASARGLANVILKPYQPRDALARSLGTADVHLISLLPMLDGLIVPSKFYGIAAAGRPSIFIGDPDGDIASILNRYNIGVVVRPGQVDALVAAIRTFRGDAEMRLAMGKRARKTFESHFDKPIATERWETLLSEASMSRKAHL